MQYSSPTQHVLSFGPFELIPSQQLLLENGKQARVGSRALALLVALVTRAGEVVSRDELVAFAWPSSVVEETSLRVHISALRKVLGDGHGGTRYITNIPGRGYCFVGQVTATARAVDGAPGADAKSRTHNLPAQLTRMVGRTGTVSALVQLLPQRRLVTITGAGGIGKTTVALAVADALQDAYRDSVRFVDLSPVATPHLVTSTLASVLGAAIDSEGAMPDLRELLQGLEMLIVLDNCEHVIEAAALLAETVMQTTAGVHILVTSREPLNIPGEWVHRLSPLESPSDADDIGLTEALRYSAVQLFTERATEAAETFRLSAATLPQVIRLCNRLDGIPLAIEFAASRVDSLGIAALTNRLDEVLVRSAHGRRTALPRHRTVAALLDWSFQLLSPAEQLVLCRLAAFRSSFSLEMARDLASDDRLSRPDVTEILMNLVDKSLIATEMNNEVVRYRLLMTTRSYAASMLQVLAPGERSESRHARCMRGLLDQWWDLQSREQWSETYCLNADDIRAALDWCFSPEGDLSIGIPLTAAAHLPLYEVGLNLTSECDRALSRIHELAEAEPVAELRLNAALLMSQSTMFGRSYAGVLARTLELGQELDAPRYRIHAHYSAWIRAWAYGDYPSLGTSVTAIRDATTTPPDPSAQILIDRLLAQSYHFMGNHEMAQTLADRVLRNPARQTPRQYVTTVPPSILMRILLARTLWLRGNADQAWELALATLASAKENHTGSGPSLTLSLAVCPIALWRGENLLASDWSAQLMQHSLSHGYAYYQSWAEIFAAVIALRQAEAEPTEPNDHSDRIINVTNPKQLDCLATLAGCFVSDIAIARAEAGVVGWCAPEVFRIQGERLMTAGAVDAAENKFQQSLQLAREQGALAWQLRTSTSMAKLLIQQNRRAQAEKLLRSIYGEFTEGFATVDLRHARDLLFELQPRSRSDELPAEA